MKRILIFVVVGLASVFQVCAQKGTVSFWDKENTLDSITVGSDFSVATHKGISSVSHTKSGTLYNYYYKQTGYVGEKDIKIRSFSVSVLNNKILFISASFSEDGPEMLKKMNSIYGFSGKQMERGLDRYGWDIGKVRSIIDYSNHKRKYITLVDMNALRQSASSSDSLKYNVSSGPAVGDTILNRPNYFIAMQYKGFSNCIYKVFITDSLIMCAKVNGYIAVEPTLGLAKSVSKSRMHDPEAYVDKKLEAKYNDLLLSDVKGFLRVSNLNFIIRRKDVESVFNSTQKKWGMGYYPYGGRIFIRAHHLDLSFSEFILVGDQDPVNVLSKLTQ